MTLYDCLQYFCFFDDLDLLPVVCCTHIKVRAVYTGTRSISSKEKQKMRIEVIYCLIESQTNKRLKPSKEEEIKSERQQQQQQADRQKTTQSD